MLDHAFRPIRGWGGLTRLHRVSRVAVRSFGNEEPIDIDALAKRLSSEASRLSQENADLDRLQPAMPRPPEQSDVLPIESVFGKEDAKALGTALGEIGTPPLRATDFVIFQELGSLQVQQIVAGDITGSFSDSDVELVPSVVAYAATYDTGRPFQNAVTVLLKEFLPGSCKAGITELQVLSAMQALPGENAWQAASRPIEDNGIVPAIGWFWAPPTQEIRGHADTGAQSVWVVYKWEALKPIVAYPAAPQAPATGIVRLWDRAAVAPKALRHAMLRAVMRGALRAVDKCHRDGVVHGSLGTASILVNTFDDARAAELVVKLDNFGFAQRIVGGGGSGGDAGGPLAYGKRVDCRALAVALCETIFCSLSAEGLSPASDAAALQRLVNEVFVEDIAAFRSYAENVEEWSDAVAFLDEVDGSGWDLLDALMAADQSCGQLLEAPFLNA